MHYSNQRIYKVRSTVSIKAKINKSDKRQTFYHIRTKKREKRKIA